jgi:leucyl/phenylalanyl-tRNA---protein transferase
MPVYQLDNELRFPHPSLSREDGLLAIGGDLSPERLILAYSNGIFPWYNVGEPILWWSPNPRLVLYPDDFKLHKSLSQNIRKFDYHFAINQNFDQVIHLCSVMPRKSQDGTWITNEMKDAYKTLFRKGFAFSVETFQGNDLVGGFYGVNIGSVFFGESMFHLQKDASKAALLFLCQMAEELNIKLIDVQQDTAHMRSLGAKLMDRNNFLLKLAEYGA